MEKIIGTKRYNTDTAELIGSHGQTEIYRKRTGEFFLFDGQDMTPLTKQESQNWIKRNIPDKIETYFPEPKQDIGIIVGQRIRDRRKKLRKSLNEMSETVGIHYRQYARYEKGQVCRYDTLIKIAKGLGVKPGQLLD